MPDSATDPLNRPAEASARPRTRSLLTADCGPLMAYLPAVVLALLFVALIYPPAFLAGHGGFFEHGDGAQHATGWLLYAQDAWRFPLMHTARLNFPDGASIVFTDSIPLAAVLLKPLAGLLPAGAHHIGAWHVVAFATQAPAAVFLVRSLGARHLLAAVAAAAFALLWPPLLFRAAAHTSLMTHALLLVSLGLYFRGTSGNDAHGTAARTAIGVCIAALLVHPYLAAMCLAVFFAQLADRVAAGETVRRQLPRIATLVALLAATAVVFGYSGGSRASGFGHYSMNLLSPFCADSLALLARCRADATGGQGEGFNYLGAGAWVVIAVSLLALHDRLVPFCRRHPALVAAAVLLFAYSLSTRVFAGQAELLSLDLPGFASRLADTFRSSGRMFWLVGYLVAFGALAALLRQPSRIALAVIVVAVGLQWLDTGPLRDRLTQTASQPSRNDLPAWEQRLAGIDLLRMYPAFGCGPVDTELYIQMQRVAAHFRLPIDTGYVARRRDDCGRDGTRSAMAPSPRHLYLVHDSALTDTGALPPAFRQAVVGGKCEKLGVLLACRHAP